MRKSFTLLEMLIVLGIIAVILSVLTVSFSTAQKKSRDAKRKGDLKALQNGMEQYYSTCSYVYPTGPGTSGAAGALPPGSAVLCGASPAVVPAVPSDPQTGVGYMYYPTGSPISGFSLCARLETENITTPAPTPNYCINSQQ